MKIVVINKKGQILDENMLRETEIEIPEYYEVMKTITARIKHSMEEQKKHA